MPGQFTQVATIEADYSEVVATLEAAKAATNSNDLL